MQTRLYLKTITHTPTHTVGTNFLHHAPQAASAHSADARRQLARSEVAPFSLSTSFSFPRVCAELRAPFSARSHNLRILNNLILFKQPTHTSKHPQPYAQTQTDTHTQTASCMARKVHGQKILRIVCV